MKLILNMMNICIKRLIKGKYENGNIFEFHGENNEKIKLLDNIK